jgi:hypothetical protein
LEIWFFIVYLLMSYVTASNLLDIFVLGTITLVVIVEGCSSNTRITYQVDVIFCFPGHVRMQFLLHRDAGAARDQRVSPALHTAEMKFRPSEWREDWHTRENGAGRIQISTFRLLRGGCVRPRAPRLHMSRQRIMTGRALGSLSLFIRHYAERRRRLIGASRCNLFGSHCAGKIHRSLGDWNSMILY